jgi:hypothetical protein
MADEDDPPALPGDLVHPAGERRHVVLDLREERLESHGVDGVSAGNQVSGDRAHTPALLMYP